MGVCRRRRVIVSTGETSSFPPPGATGRSGPSRSLCTCGAFRGAASVSFSLPLLPTSFWFHLGYDHMECDAKKEEEEKEEEGRECPSSIIGISYGWTERKKGRGVYRGRWHKLDGEQKKEKSLSASDA